MGWYNKITVVVSCDFVPILYNSSGYLTTNVGMKITNLRSPEEVTVICHEQNNYYDIVGVGMIAYDKRKKKLCNEFYEGRSQTFDAPDHTVTILCYAVVINEMTIETFFKPDSMIMETEKVFEQRELEGLTAKQLKVHRCMYRRSMQNCVYEQFKTLNKLAYLLPICTMCIICICMLFVGSE